MAPEFDPLSASIDALGSDLAINTVNPFAAAHEAVVGFEKLPSGASKTFIQSENLFPSKANRSPYESSTFEVEIIKSSYC